MDSVYTVQQTFQDHETPEGAIKEVEALGFGTVVKFRIEPNMPHCLPAFVKKSCAMWTYNMKKDGKWYAHNIFDGFGGAVEEEKPN